MRPRLHRLQIENPAAATVRQTEWVFQIADREGGRGTHTLAAVVPFPYVPPPRALQRSRAGAGIGSDVRSICLLFCYLLTDPVNNEINRFLLFLLTNWGSVIFVIFVISVNRMVIFVNSNNSCYFC